MQSSGGSVVLMNAGLKNLNLTSGGNGTLNSARNPLVNTR